MANPLEKFLDFSTLGLWQRKNNKVVGIDIGSSSVKVVQLRKDKGKVILETYGEIACGPYRGLSVGQAAVLTPEKSSEVLRDLFREANVTTSAASFSIPLASSLLVIIEIPKVDENMLAKVIPIEARKYIPVPISEVALDWWVIPNQDLKPGSTTDKLEVLVVAIHNGVISQYQDLAGITGVQSSFLEIETFSAIRSSVGGDMAASVIVDLGASTTKMAIVDLGIVRLSHTIPKGAQDITLAIARALGVEFAKAEEIKRKVGLVEHVEGQDVAATISATVEYIFSEINKVFAAYQKRQGKSISKIVLIGGGALLKGVLPLAQKSFDVPVSMGTPFDKTETPAFLQNMLHEAGPGFAVSIGLALRQLQALP